MIKVNATFVKTRINKSHILLIFVFYIFVDVHHMNLRCLVFHMLYRLDHLAFQRVFQAPLRYLACATSAIVHDDLPSPPNSRKLAVSFACVSHDHSSASSTDCSVLTRCSQKQKNKNNKKNKSVFRQLR